MAKKPKPAPTHMVDLSGVTLGTKGVAALLGLTERRLQIMVKDGIVPSSGRGKFDPAEVVKAYVAFRVDGIERRSVNTSMDRLRDVRAEREQRQMQIDDRQIISLEEAIGTLDEIIGLFISYLGGLPAEITVVPRERQRLHDIIDAGRLRLTDRFAKKIAALRTGDEAAEAETED